MKPYMAWGAVPASLPPSVPVVHLDQAASIAGFCSVAALALSVWAWHGEMAPVAFVREVFSLRGFSDSWDAAWRCGLTLAATGAAGTAAFLAGLRPVERVRYLSGPRLLSGKEARREAERLAALERKDRSAFLHLGGIGLAKSRWTRALWVFGSIGSGKSAILQGIAREIVERDYPALFLDVKGGDWIERFGRDAAILSPWDRRTFGGGWDLAQDVRTFADASTLAAALVPMTEGSGRFWSTSAQQLIVGAVIGLIRDHGRNWGWKDLADRLSVDRETMVQTLLAQEERKAATLIAESGQTSASLLATLASETRVIDDLARAWPRPHQTGGFSVRLWVNGSAKVPRRIIIGGNPEDSSLTRAWIASLFELLAPKVLALPDDEHGRSLVFVLDEIPAVGKLQGLVPLIDKGRSKGSCVLLGSQTPQQIIEKYGPNEGDALMSMSGTTIVARMQAGEAQESLAKSFGRQRVGIVGLSSSAADGAQRGSSNTSVHEETRAVVNPHDLGALRVIESKRYPAGVAVEAMVRGMGIDALQLLFPAAVLPKVCAARRMADWTKPIERVERSPSPSAPAPESPDVQSLRKVVEGARQLLEQKMENRRVENL